MILEKKSEHFFELVTSSEVDPKNGKISIESPVGLAASNKNVGDQITVKTPSGDVKFKIIEVTN